MLASGKMKAKDAAIYVVMQCLGAVVASTVLYGVALGKPGYSLAVDGLGQNGYGVASPGGFSMLSGYHCGSRVDVHFLACDIWFD